MAHHYSLTIRLYDGRYHGVDEWPPAPARVFQALVAGAAQGRHVSADAARALQLLENLAPPVIAAPHARRGQRVFIFVPNNDLDSVDGDPDRVGEVRSKKMVQPFLLAGEAKFVYAWPLSETAPGEDLIALAEGLYQLGRGIDPAWAVGEVLDDEQLAARLRSFSGTIHRPVSGGGSSDLATPTRSSFVSIVHRFEAALSRLRPSGDGKTNFVQPPKAHFAMTHYDGTPPLHLFELRSDSDPAKFSPWTAWCATRLIERVRDMAVAVLSNALPERKAEIERVLIGRKTNGENAGPIEERVRFIPLPSIGHEYADQSIRRVLVQIPPGPLAEGDVLWALAGRTLFDEATGELGNTMLAAAPADDMAKRYRESSRTWKSVTPLALGSASRRRIDPARQHEEAKSATERGAEERAARHAVAQALRHAAVDATLVCVRVQREPFESHGMRAERFAEGTRFAKEALWHVELELDRSIPGPLVLGDGRFLGLGVMAPKIQRGVFALDVEGGLGEGVDTTLLARALRRALMARVQGVLGARSELPLYFHGHASDDEPPNDERSTHLAFSVDVVGSRLLIVPPHILDGWKRPRDDAESHLEILERALQGFTTLRAGRAGVLSLRVFPLSTTDALLQSSRVFRSVSDYVVTRHPKRSSAEEAVVIDVQRECERRGLPAPMAVRVMSARGVAGVGVIARVELTFAVAVRGPILLGKTRYLGGGLFRPVLGKEQSTISRYRQPSSSRSHRYNPQVPASETR